MNQPKVWTSPRAKNGDPLTEDALAAIWQEKAIRLAENPEAEAWFEQVAKEVASDAMNKPTAFQFVRQRVFIDLAS